MEENTQNLNKKIIDNIEEEEENLIEEEKLLNEELNLIQEKHKDVRLVYEKVTENIKNITKSDPKKFDDNSGFINNNSDFLNNSHLDSSENYIKPNVYDDELIRLYKEYLDSIKKNYQTNFMDKNKNDLLEKYKDQFSFSYHRFESNLGGTSLVQQWNRCLDLVQNETWVQILGDDDTLAPNVVASFYENLPEITEVNSAVVRFATQVIDEKNTTTSSLFTNPQKEFGFDFLERFSSPSSPANALVKINRDITEIVKIFFIIG